MGISFHVALSGALSLISLIAWILLFIKKKHLAVLIFSILLAIFGLPLIFEFSSVLNGANHSSDPMVFLIILFVLGGGDFALAAFGIIYSAIMISRSQSG